MGASSRRPGSVATGCWPLRRLWQRHSRSKAADSTQNHEDGSPAASKGLDKDGAADGCSMTAPPPAEPVVCQAVHMVPARDARLSLDSMAGDEYSAYQAGLPAPSAHGSDSPWQRQLPPLQEVPPAYGVGAEDEAERLDEVRSSLAIVQGGHPGLDSITQLCAKLYRVPVAAANLITDSRLVFASVAGQLAGEWGTGTDRSGSFCEALLLPQVHTLLCVPDARLDDRFRFLACVAGNPGVRFYAGTPLVSSRGHRLGSLCIFDLRPRRLSADALNLLACLAEMAARLLEEHQAAELQREQQRRRAAERAALQREPAALRLPILLCDASDPRWPVIWSNQAAASLAGLPQRLLQYKGLFELFASEAGPRAPPALAEAARMQRPCALRVALLGGAHWAWAQFSPASQQLLDGAQSHPHIDVLAAVHAGGAASPRADLGLYFVALEAL